MSSEQPAENSLQLNTLGPHRNKFFFNEKLNSLNVYILVIVDPETSEELKIWKNKPGNSGITSYTIQFADGSKRLMVEGSKYIFPALKKNSSFLMHLRFGKEKVEVINKSQQDIQYAVDCQNNLGVEVLVTGNDQRFGGEVNGGRSYFVINVGICGVGRSSKRFTEDRAGVSDTNGFTVLAVADGLGGVPLSEHASASVINNLVKSPRTLKNALDDAQNEYQQFIEYIETQPNQDKPDTVVSALKIEGDELKECIQLGDTKWCIIRHDKVVAKSLVHECPRYEETFDPDTGESIFQKTRFTNPTTTFFHFFHPTYTCKLKNASGKFEIEELPFKLMENDVVILHSDGLNALSDQEKIQCVKGNVAEKIAQKLINLASQKNKYGVPKAPYDHTTVCVYTHSLPPLKRLQLKIKQLVNNFFNQLNT